MSRQPVEHARESIRLFSLCEAMGWAALPVAGGLYDQHPQLIEEWATIFQARAEHDRLEQSKRDREQSARSKRRR